MNNMIVMLGTALAPTVAATSGIIAASEITESSTVTIAIAVGVSVFSATMAWKASKLLADIQGRQRSHARRLKRLESKAGFKHEAIDDDTEND